MKRFLSLILTLSLLLGCMSGLARAEDTGNTGKYVQDVFIAYGKTEDEARAWLTANGWEPVNGDFCAGKNSTWDDPIAAVMGIKRTDDAKNAITDMAVMNMSGGYSFPAYEDLLDKKKAQIDEFINGFMPIIEEYRDNYNGRGSALGKKRADLVYEVLNKFYDGSKTERYAKNDTGRRLGELFLEPTRQEGSTNGADLQQIILESSGAAMMAVEQLLGMAADTGAETWLERLSGLTGKDLSKNLSKYVPEAAGQNLAASAINTFLRERFGDVSRILASQWSDINVELVWYEKYCDAHELWPEEDESPESYQARLDAYFEPLKTTNEKQYDEDHDRFTEDAILYEDLYASDYKGGWGDTLGDFFNPYDGKNYGADADNFLTFAAAMSPGQRAATELLSLRSMLLLGFADGQGMDYAKPDLDALFEEAPELSIYSGINRGIFRGGVALTSKARMDEHSGRGEAFNELYDHLGMYSMLSTCAAIVGVPMFLAGIHAILKGRNFISTGNAAKISGWTEQLQRIKNFNSAWDITEKSPNYIKLEKQIAEEQARGYYETTKLGIHGRVMLGIGAVFIIGAALLKAYQLYEYYQHTFTPIPLMIVDEADIVTYTTDSEGNSVENIDFDQYVYYEAVKCNRQEVGEISDWQDGVAQYAEQGCGDVADLNGDFGQEWLALYTVKSPKKGDPILADTLTVQYGSNHQPKNCNEQLHFFCYTYAADLGDTAYSFNNEKNGIYLFWDSDPKAYDTPKTASAFTGGQLAMSGAAGLLIGILGTTLALYPKRKKEDPLIS